MSEWVSFYCRWPAQYGMAYRYCAQGALACLAPACILVTWWDLPWTFFQMEPIVPLELSIPVPDQRESSVSLSCKRFLQTNDTKYEKGSSSSLTQNSHVAIYRCRLVHGVFQVQSLFHTSKYSLQKQHRVIWNLVSLLLSHWQTQMLFYPIYLLVEDCNTRNMQVQENNSWVTSYFLTT